MAVSERLLSEDDVWRYILSSKHSPTARLPESTLAGSAARQLADLLYPLLSPQPRPFRPVVFAHLAQSLDGCIATQSGQSQWISGEDDIRHTHRLRAIADAVLVGANTIREDDPRLTVREVSGDNPVRIVIDPDRRLGPHYQVFADQAADTLLVCDEALTGEKAGEGQTVIGVRCRDRVLDLADLLAKLAGRGVRRLFVEGGGITVSRFLARNCLDRLHLTIAPVIVGAGRRGLILPEVDRLHQALRPAIRQFPMGQDTLIDCDFRA